MIPSDAVAERHPSATVIIPPRMTLVADETTATQRDRHLAIIDEHGRMAWQRRSGYNRRSLVETPMFRYKTIIGRAQRRGSYIKRMGHVPADKTKAVHGRHFVSSSRRLKPAALSAVVCSALFGSSPLETRAKPSNAPPLDTPAMRIETAMP
jgi:hypothetical protein